MSTIKVYCQHTHNDEGLPVICKTYDEGVKLVHEHFLSYGFELVDGLAIDPLEEGDSKEVFSDVIISKGMVASFKHYNEDGPVGKVHVVPFFNVCSSLFDSSGGMSFEIGGESFYDRLGDVETFYDRFMAAQVADQGRIAIAEANAVDDYWRGMI